MKTLYLIDASGFIFRAYYALPQLNRSDGTNVGAVFGFCNMLLKLREVINQKLKEENFSETYWACIFDAAKKNFRHEIDQSYKSNRKETPQDLIPQFPLVRDAAKAFGCPVVELDGFEADDIIASFSKKANLIGMSVIIVSSDKDFMQLYKNKKDYPKTLIFDPMKNKWINEQDIQEKFFVSPDKIPDVQALAGDSSDGITGVPGIGVKTAAELIKQFGSLETLLSNIHTINQTKRRAILVEYAEKARIAKKLVTLRDDVLVNFSEHNFSFQNKISTQTRRDMVSFFSQQEFLSLKNKFDK